MTWVDATLQQILSARLLAQMGRALGADGATSPTCARRPRAWAGS